MKARILGLVIVGAGCLAALPAFASPATDGVHARYASIRESDVKNGLADIDISHQARHFGAPIVDRGEHHDWGSWKPSDPTPTPAAAPEMSQSSAATALTLLLGGLALFCARRRRA